MKKVLLMTFIAIAIVSCNNDKQITKEDSLQQAKFDSLQKMYNSIADTIINYGQPLRKIENYLVVHNTGTDTLAQNGQIQFIAYDAEWDGDTTLINRWRIDIIVVNNQIILKQNLVSLTPIK